MKLLNRIVPILVISLVSVFSLFNNQTKASHIPGANLTWTCDPNNPLTYTFTFTEFVSCPSTLPSTQSPSYFTITNNCGLANPVVPTFTQVGSAVDVSQTCASQTSACAGGSIPGVMMYTYQATITFPADCDSWIIDYNLCCRDANSNTTGGSGNDMHVQSILNTLTAPCNNGPVVTSQPIPYMCAGQNNTYCITYSDPDADSTVFQMTDPLGFNGTPIAYNAPYSVNSPLQGFTLDPQTGCMTFNQPTTGNFVVAVLIESYDASGNLISSIIHDFQFEIINCSNTPPSPPTGGISNFSGTGTQTGPNSVSTCIGETVCFDVVFSDPNSGNNLTITTNGTSILPGATFTQTGTNPATGTFCWTAVPGYSGQVVNFVVEDDACPIVGQSSYSVNFNILDGIYAGPDYTICSGSVQLQATGGVSYTWTPATGLSCTNCANPVASPTTSTTYIVTGTPLGSCPSTSDTVTVNVQFPGTLTAWAVDSTLCPGDNTQLNAVLTLNNPPAQPCGASPYPCSGPSNTYTIGTGTNTTSYPSPYQGYWHDARVQMIFTAAELTAAGIVPGNISSIAFNVSSKASTQPYNGFTIKMGCTSQSAYTSAAYISGLTTVMGPIAYTPNVGWNTHLFSTPYYWDGVSNLVVEICFDNTSYTQHDPVFKMTTGFQSVVYDYADNSSGCTLNTPITTNLRPNVRFQNCSVTVPSAFNYSWSPTTNLSNPNIANPNVTNLTTTTTYTVTSYDPNDPSCTISVPVTIYVNDVDAGPDINICLGGSANLNAVGTSGCSTGGSYSWSPTTGLSNANIANPIASPTVNTTYIVAWNDGCSGCIVYDTIDIIVTPAPQPTMTSTAETCQGNNDGTATATPNGMTAPYTFSWNTTPVQNTQTATGLAPGTYTVTVTDANGCTATNTVTVNPGPLITAGFNPPAAQCLTGNSFSFTNTGSTGAGISFNWDFGDGVGTSTLENPTYSYSAAGTYTVTQTVTNGTCTDIVTQTVTVYDMPVPVVISDSVNCNGGSDGTATVTTVNNSPGPFSYSWNTTPVQTTNPATGLASGTYTVTVTDQTTNCQGQATVTVYEPPLLTVNTTPTDPSCNGFTDGQALANASGGTPGYTYSWNSIPVQSSNPATGLGAGTYQVTVTDANGCTATANATLTDPPGLVLNPSFTQANCGQPDGTASVSVVSGGSGSYSYSWNTAPVQTTQTATGLLAGTYQVTVTDNGTGCTQDTTVTVTSTSGITANATLINDALCNGSNDGQAYATPTGGTAPYTYSWNSTPVQNNDTITAGAGTYIVTITDANGCTGNATITIAEPTPVTASITASNDPSCFGGNNGDATAQGNGGTPGYSYSWATTPVQNTQTATGLAAGTYTVTVTDANGCTANTTVTLNDGIPLTSSIIPTDVTCNGGSNGSANLTVNGGVGPYTYNWTPGGYTGEDPVGLSAGTYYVTINDQSGCSTMDTVTINEPTPVVAVIDSTTNITCFGYGDGAAYASASGGTPGYTYSWNPGGQTGSSATGLTPGTYTVTVTDANGCTASVNTSITEPVQITGTPVTIDAYCGLNTGTASIILNGGVAPFTYDWTDISGTISTNDTLYNANPGTYSLTVTDSTGCKLVTNITINAAPGGTASISNTTDVSCNGGNDGTATVSVAGAYPSYSYQWDAAAGNQTTNPATGLAAGNYTVTVTDSLGCVMTATATINEPTPLNLSLVLYEPQSCFNSCDGRAFPTISGGTPPYTFQWNDPMLQTTDTANNLCAGWVSLTVTDSKGCTITDSINIPQPAPLVISTSAVAANCNQNDGSATVNIVSGAQGAPSAITYSWNTTPVQTTQTASNIPAGTYTVIVTDENGCTATDTATVPNLSGPTLSVDTVQNVSCNGFNDGFTSVSVVGGTFPYTYSWTTTPVQNTPSATNLTAGSYTVTVTDSNGCVVSTSVTITEPPVLGANIFGNDPTCFGYNDGSAWVATFGGTAPYTYSWSTTPVQTNDTATGLAAGNPTVIITDANGCTVTQNIWLNNPPLMTVATTPYNVTCFGACDGSASTQITNGVAPFTYLWNDPSAQTVDSAFALCAGTYNVTVTDNDGCMANGTVTITEPAILDATISASGNVSCNGGNDGFANVNVTGGTGPYTYFWSPGNYTTPSPNTLSAGTYTVTVTDANGCTDVEVVTITEPQALSASYSSSDVSCNGGNDGQASVIVNGGTQPYSYQWDDLNLQQTDTAYNLIAGTYNIVITDANSCTYTINNIVINEPTPLSLTVSTDTSTCGFANGAATVSVGGGTPSYNYNWNTTPVQTTATANGLLAGSYIVVVTDANGCKDSINANVIDAGSPTVTIASTTNVSCNGAADGSATAQVTGGTPGYTYSWNTNPVQNTITASNLSGGTYSITVTDANGCTASATATINENSGLSVQINNSTNVSCFGGNDGTASLITAGGNGGNTYSWNTVPVQTTQTATGLTAGTYIATVTDSNGCSKSDTVTITEPALLQVSLLSSTDVTCNGGNDGAITVNVTGGTQGYAYVWTPNVSNGSTAAGLIAGSYTVDITDANGCTTSGTYTINEPTPILLDSMMTPSTCGMANGSAGVNPTGGTPGYSYQWNDPNSQTTSTASNLLSSVYTVVVTDANGCTATKQFFVDDIPGPRLDSIVTTNVLCNGQSNGTATAYATGNNLTYQWNDPNNQTTQTATGLSASPPLYTVVVTDLSTGCSDQMVAVITQPAPLTALISAPDTICSGQPIQLFGNGNGGTQPYNYNWTTLGNTTQGPIQLNPTTTTNYPLVITDANGCTANASHFVYVRAPLSLTVNDVTICEGNTASVSPSTTTGGNGNYTYYWFEYDGTNYLPTGQPNPTNPLTVSPTDTTQYMVYVADGCSQNDSVYFNINVNDTTEMQVVTVNNAGCPPWTADFTPVILNNTNGTLYEWDFDGDGTIDMSSPTPNINYTYQNTGNYNVIVYVTNNNGCQSTFVLNNWIDVYPVPIADFTANPSVVTLLNPTIEFTDQSFGATIFNWDFGVPFDGTDTSNQQNPTYTYQDTGSYTVWLVVENQYGCKDSISNMVIVKPEHVVYVPNTFTPNGDGLNDTFFPKGIGIDDKNYSFWIFDRWGELIYEVYNSDEGWDGTANGGTEIVQTGTYVWVLKTKDLEGIEHTYRGHVNLIK